MSAHGLAQAQRKMTEGEVHPTAIDVFSRFYGLLESGETGVIPEADVTPLADVPHLTDLDVPDDVARDALAVTAVVKLNGGLGTSMGMDRAKSLPSHDTGKEWLPPTFGPSATATALPVRSASISTTRVSTSPGRTSSAS